MPSVTLTSRIFELPSTASSPLRSLLDDTSFGTIAFWMLRSGWWWHGLAGVRAKMPGGSCERWTKKIVSRSPCTLILPTIACV